MRIGFLDIPILNFKFSCRFMSFNRRAKALRYFFIRQSIFVFQTIDGSRLIRTIQVIREIFDHNLIFSKLGHRYVDDDRAIFK